MYHNNKDLRVRKSSELIYQAVITCLESKKLEEIHISDLEKVSTVSRSTFYRNFDSIVDVLQWKCDLEFSTMLNQFISSPIETRPEGFLHFFFTYWFEREQLIQIIFEQHRIDILYQSLLTNSYILEEYFKEISHKNSCGIYYFPMRIGLIISIFITWFQNGKQETPEEICAMLMEHLEELNGLDVIF
ncbi:MAG: TetR/AcrR family transcriptional regulator [Eubacteriales bacterium]